MTESQTMTLIKRIRKALIISRNKEMNTQEKIKSMKKYKITLTEFWNSNKLMAIHCDTEEKANKLLEAFDKLGKKWRDEKSYLDLKQNRWSSHNNFTCYSNNCGYASIDFYKEDGYTIYEFEDVDLDK